MHKGGLRLCEAWAKMELQTSFMVFTPPHCQYRPTPIWWLHGQPNWNTKRCQHVSGNMAAVPSTLRLVANGRVVGGPRGAPIQSLSLGFSGGSWQVLDCCICRACILKSLNFSFISSKVSVYRFAENSRYTATAASRKPFNRLQVDVHWLRKMFDHCDMLLIMLKSLLTTWLRGYVECVHMRTKNTASLGREVEKGFPVAFSASNLAVRHVGTEKVSVTRW